MKIGKDKLLHFLGGIIVASLCIFVVGMMPWEGFYYAFATGLLKELIWDALWKNGMPEGMDMLATTAGGFIVYIGAIIYG